MKVIRGADKDEGNRGHQVIIFVIMISKSILLERTL